MLEQLFLTVLNMSFAGSVVLLVVLLLRLLLKKAPKVFSYTLWTVVFFRLACPFSLESAVSLFPVHPSPIPSDIAVSAAPAVNTGIEAVDRVVSAVLPEPSVTSSVNPLQVILFAAAVLWILGIVVMLIYNLAAIFFLKRRLSSACREDGNIYLSTEIDTPFVMGLFRPKIYLPGTLGEPEREYILLHERTHIRRGDHVVKLTAFAILCAHWFNPLVWLAFFLLGKDMEMSCDESVIAKLGPDVKKSYSSSLLALASGRRIVGGAPLAFGEGETKSRIQNVLRYKKPAFWILAVVFAAVAAVAVGFAVNPKSNDNLSGGVKGLGLSDTQKADLDSAISEAVLTQGKSAQTRGAATESHVVLGTETKSDAASNRVVSVTAYIMELYQELYYEDGQLKESSGHHMPTALTFDITEDGSYRLREHWIPKDGNQYSDSIKGRFPLAIAGEAMNTQKYITAQMISCYEQGALLCMPGTDEAISQLLKTVCSSPAYQSDVASYIDAHPIEFRTLVYYGRNTIRYAAALFESASWDTLEGHVLVRACTDILEAKGETVKGGAYGSPQNWYSTNREKIEKYL